MKNFLLLLIISLVFSFIGCSKKKDITGPPVRSSHAVYEITSTEGYSITDAVIEKGFLRVTVSAPGCDGNTWVVNMIDSQTFNDSNPPTRYLRLSVKNEETCTSMVTKTYYFDLSGLRVVAFKTIMLQLDGFNGQLKYSW